MKVQYDSEADALYLELGTQQPDGVVEVAAGVNLDTTGDGKVVGIEILDASRKIDIDSLLTYTLDLDRGLMRVADENTWPAR